MRNLFDPSDMPFGLGVALAANPDAKKRFDSMPKSERRDVVVGAHNIKSEEEMNAYVRSLVD